MILIVSIMALIRGPRYTQENTAPRLGSHLGPATPAGNDGTFHHQASLGLEPLPGGS